MRRKTVETVGNVDVIPNLLQTISEVEVYWLFSECLNTCKAFFMQPLASFIQNCINYSIIAIANV